MRRIDFCNELCSADTEPQQGLLVEVVVGVSWRKKTNNKFVPDRALAAGSNAATSLMSFVNSPTCLPACSTLSPQGEPHWVDISSQSKTPPPTPCEEVPQANERTATDGENICFIAFILFIPSIIYVRVCSKVACWVSEGFGCFGLF